jgi:hypothetical protein
VTTWSVRYYRDERGRLPVAEFFEMPSSIGITKPELARLRAHLKLVRDEGLVLITRRSDILEAIRGEDNLYSLRLNRTKNNPRVLVCALPEHRCMVLLHAFKELHKNAYRHELPKARTRRDRVVADPTRWVDPT